MQVPLSTLHIRKKGLGSSIMSQDAEQSPFPSPTSRPNTELVLHPEHSIEALRPGPPTVNGPVVAALEEQLEDIKTDRKKERYFWIFVVTALLNVIIASFAPTFAASIMLLFSLVMLIGIAKYLGVPWVVVHLESWFSKICSPTKPGETE